MTLKKNLLQLWILSLREEKKGRPTVNSLASLPAQLESDCGRMTGPVYLRWVTEHPCCPEGRLPGPTCVPLVPLKMTLIFPLKISKQSFYICPVWVLAKANHAEEDSKQQCLSCIVYLRTVRDWTQQAEQGPVCLPSPPLSRILPFCVKSWETLEPLCIMLFLDLEMLVSWSEKGTHKTTAHLRRAHPALSHLWYQGHSVPVVSPWFPSYLVVMLDTNHLNVFWAVLILSSILYCFCFCFFFLFILSKSLLAAKINSLMM